MRLLHRQSLARAIEVGTFELAHSWSALRIRRRWIDDALWCLSLDCRHSNLHGELEQTLEVDISELIAHADARVKQSLLQDGLAERESRAEQGAGDVKDRNQSRSARQRHSKVCTDRGMMRSSSQ